MVTKNSVAKINNCLIFQIGAVTYFNEIYKWII